LLVPVSYSGFSTALTVFLVCRRNLDVPYVVSDSTKAAMDDLSNASNHGDNLDSNGPQPDYPWIVLSTTYDVEMWIDNYNRELQRSISGKNPVGYGICFCLLHGGEIYLHTTSEGEIVLDVTPDAEWVTPVITATTRVQPPRGQIWALPGEVLTQLILGLTTLIASTRLVMEHDFKIRKY